MSNDLHDVKLIEMICIGGPGRRALRGEALSNDNSLTSPHVVFLRSPVPEPPVLRLKGLSLSLWGIMRTALRPEMFIRVPMTCLGCGSG